MARNGAAFSVDPGPDTKDNNAEYARNCLHYRDIGDFLVFPVA
jgi:hypothetical protein